MNLRSLKKELLNAAQAKDACPQGIGELQKAESLKELFDLYWEYIRYCAGADFPSRTLLKYHLKTECNQNWIFLDDKVTLKCTGTRTKAVFLGSSNGQVQAGGVLCRLFVKHQSDVSVMVQGGCHLVVDLFDNARVNITLLDNARATVVKMGGQVEGENVRVIEKTINEYLEP